MSTTKKINQGAVTSLADTDLVMACDTSGTYRPIPITKLMDLIRSGIRTGARNYARGSASITYTAPNTGSNADNYSYYNISVGKVKSGDIFYVGADDISILSGSPSQFTVIMLNSHNNTISDYMKMTLQDRHCFVKAYADDDNASIAIYAGVAGSTRGNKITFSKLMVAKSNIKVDWQLAPEDVASLSGG